VTVVATEANFLQRAVAADELIDSVGTDLDAMQLQGLRGLLSEIDREAVGQHGNTASPREQIEGECCGVAVVSDDADAQSGDAGSVTVGAVVDRVTVEGVDTGHVRQKIAQSVGKDHAVRVHAFTVIERNLEVLLRPGDARDSTYAVVRAGIYCLKPHPCTELERRRVG
jgi:hypothetical protein